MDTTENEDDAKNVFGDTEFYKCEVEEFNLYKHCNCDKNPGHEKFIAADKFTISDLPEMYREQKNLDFIKIVSDLTVRIAVTEISEDRPDYVPDTEIPYTCSTERGKKGQYTGSGKIKHVFNVEKPKKCQCKECLKKDQAKDVCGEIWIDTAAHVVFDKFEAENTTCRLFFDKEFCDKVIIIQGVDVIDVNVRRDYCTLICETCDEDLMKDLKEKLETFETLERLIYKTVEKPLPSEKMFIVISHPHGTSKQITYGQTSAKIEHENIFSKQFYDTPTCSGSSGAPVLVFGYIGWYSGIVHSGTKWTLNSKDDVYNYSTLGFDYLFPPSLTKTGSRESMAICKSSELCTISFDDEQSKKESASSDTSNTKKSKANVFEETTSKQNESKETKRSLLKLTPVENGEESNKKDIYVYDTGSYDLPLYKPVESKLQRYFKRCSKINGHSKFIPVNKFSIDHLPENYQNTHLYDLIKSISVITVKIGVRWVSSDRPDFHPGSKCRYPLSRRRGNTVLRYGTGFIYDIIKYTDGYKCCECHKCQASEAPSKIWFEVIVFTVAHLVFDDIEAKHTTARLFYDKEDSDTIILKDNVRTIKVSVEDGVCILKFTTCDASIAILTPIIERVKHLKSDVYRKYAQTDLDNLIVLISHPHGCSKQISVGHCKEVITVGKLREKFIYTTCTCNGSSGAPVYNLKSKQISLHFGTLEHKILSGNTCFTE